MSDLKIAWPKSITSIFFPQCHWLNLGNGTIFRIGAFFTCVQINGPRNGFFVAIEDKGAFLFSEELPLDFQYVAEKLNLMESDARNMADWINAQLGFNADNQGIYTRAYIESNEPYGLIGESKQLPYVPLIIEDKNGI